jgi:hypothetical protein
MENRVSKLNIRRGEIKNDTMKKNKSLSTEQKDVEEIGTKERDVWGGNRGNAGKLWKVEPTIGEGLTMTVGGRAPCREGVPWPFVAADPASLSGLDWTPRAGNCGAC